MSIKLATSSGSIRATFDSDSTSPLKSETQSASTPPNPPNTANIPDTPDMPDTPDTQTNMPAAPVPAQPSVPSSPSAPMAMGSSDISTSSSSQAPIISSPSGSCTGTECITCTFDNCTYRGKSVQRGSYLACPDSDGTKCIVIPPGYGSTCTGHVCYSVPPGFGTSCVRDKCVLVPPGQCVTNDKVVPC
jgi:hypothetical protein